MRRRIPWSFVVGLGAGLCLLGLAARGSRRGRRAPAGGRGARLAWEPEVVRSHGPTPVEAGLEKPVASARPDAIPDRASRSIPRPRRPAPPSPARFEPVVPDAPEVRDPTLEPHGADDEAPSATPVPPQVRHRR